MKRVDITDIVNSSERKFFLEKSLDSNGLEIIVEFPAVFWSSKVLRDLVVDVSDYFHLDKTWTSRLTLIADELNNNSVEYWSNEEDINTMMLKIWTKDNKVDFILEVQDSGKWDHAKTAIEMENLKNKKEDYNYSNHTSIRWRGLFLIIKKIVDELYFRDAEWGGLIVGVKKEIQLES